MRHVKKILIAVVVVVALAAGGLWLTSRLSDCYKLATAEIKTSAPLHDRIGEFNSSLLIGDHFNLAPGGTSCASLRFLVKSSNGVHAVEVLARKRDYLKSWEIYDMVVGFRNVSEQSCRG